MRRTAAASGWGHDGKKSCNSLIDNKLGLLLVCCLWKGAVLGLAMMMAGCGTLSHGPNLGKGRTDSCTFAMPEGEYNCNLPCRIISVHPEKEGKAVLFLWLHGGVKVRSAHDLFMENHFDYCEADDIIVNYLRKNNMKAIAILPICYKAVNPKCISWDECYDDVKHIIDDFVEKGLVDRRRVYLAGSSDGGNGAWDYASAHPDVFAAAIAMSCTDVKETSIPVFFFNTSDEPDSTEAVEALTRKGCPIRYRHCPEYTHGGDAAECTDELLRTFFGYSRP